MSKVGIVTDSASCVPEKFQKELDIRVVPIGLVIDGKRYKDNELTNEEFWWLFHLSKRPVTTTGISPEGFIQAYQDLSKSTDTILCIVLSHKLSVIHQSAVYAAEIVKQDNPNLTIEVIDSNTATGATGFLVIEAARAAQAGKSLAETAQVVKDMIPKVKWLMAMDTLKYLIRGGRAPKAAALADIAGIKPITGMVSGLGVVESLARARGKEKAMAKLVELMKQHIDTSKPVHLMVHYTDGIAPAEKLRNIITSQIKCDEVYLSHFTPVMAAHTGPVVAISFYS